MHPEAKTIVAARPCGAMADLKAPTVTLRLQREVEPGITSFGVFLEFSEPVTGLNLSADSEDVLVDIGDHSEITGTGSQTFFTRITSSQDGELTITVPAGAVTDLDPRQRQPGRVAYAHGGHTAHHHQRRRGPG